jgi:hypothetical protein
MSRDSVQLNPNIDRYMTRSAVVGSEPTTSVTGVTTTYITGMEEATMVQRQTAVTTGTRRAMTTNVRVVCRPTPKELQGARKALALWRANDPDFMQAIFAENWLTLMSNLIPDVEGGPAPPSCDADGCDLGTHRQVYHFAQMAALNKLTVGIKALKRAANALGVPAPDTCSLSPFLGRANTMTVPSHVVPVLKEFGVSRDCYSSWRRRGAKPARRNLEYNFRFMDEERAKLLRLVHGVAVRRAGVLHDPEFGETPTTPTERALLDGADRQKLRAYIEGPVSGHDLREVTFLSEVGLRAHAAEVLVRTHVSDASNSMYTIFGAEGPLDSLVAVSELEFLWLLARELDGDVRGAALKYGRGLRAEELAKAILQRLGN